jgi:RNA polymerase sigma-32 factor
MKAARFNFLLSFGSPWRCFMARKFKLVGAPRLKIAENPEGFLAYVEENALSHRWTRHADEAALHELVRSHLGLVIRIAQDYAFAAPVEDLIQQGNLGLLIAARRFDARKEARLATYATYWIRAEILQYLKDTHGPVRYVTTRSRSKIFFGLGRARRQAMREGIEAPSNAYLANKLGVKEEELEYIAPRLAGTDVSLDAPAYEGSSSLASKLSAGGPSPEELVVAYDAEARAKSRIKAALALLDPRERSIIKARYLSPEKKKPTLSVLGKKFGISRERVRQLEVRARDKIRAHLAA